MATVKVKIKLKTPEENGRKRPIHENYRCSVVFNYKYPFLITKSNSSIAEFANLVQFDQFNYEGDAQILSTPYSDIELVKNTKFNMYEGSRLIGVGTII